MKIVILSGVSGSGKSTYAKTLAEPKDLVVVSADHYFMVDGEYKFDPRKLGEAHAQCLRAFIGEVTKGGDDDRVIVVDNTNTTVAELAPYVAISAAYGHRPVLATVVAKLEEAAARNLHGVPIQTIKRQWINIQNRGIPIFWQIDHKIVKDGREVSPVGPDGVMIDFE